jgi:DNA-binding LytR/AlgR family response regulator
MMIKVLIDKSDLSLITDDLESSSLDITNHDDGSITLLVDDTSLEVLESILRKVTISRQAFIFETSDGWVKLFIREIIYIESFGVEIIVHTTKRGKIYIKQPLYQLEGLLQSYQIIRIAKSFLVNLDKILYIRPKLNAKLELELVNGLKIDVSRSYVKPFKDALGIGG